MNFDVRLARRQDASGITRIIRDVWQEGTLPDVLVRQIAGHSSSALHVASRGGEVLGFVSAFTTTGAAGTSRREIDLIAVHPAARGQGLGHRLLAASMAAVPPYIPVMRAFIRADNAASRAVFARAGFAPRDEFLTLVVWRAQAGVTAGITAGHAVPVDTLIYRGYWLEGLGEASPGELADSVTALRAQAASEGRKEIGAMLSEHVISRMPRPLLSAGHRAGIYHEWLYPTA